MELATIIADNDNIIESFKDTGRMPELVDSLALASKSLLALNERDTAGGEKRKRNRDSRELARKMTIWNVKA